MNIITYLVRRQIRKNYVSCADDVSMSVCMNVFVEPNALMIVWLILVIV